MDFECNIKDTIFLIQIHFVKKYKSAFFDIYISVEAVEMLAYIIQFYLQIRMRQFVRQEMAEIKKVSALKKKAAKLCDT